MGKYPMPNLMMGLEGVGSVIETSCDNTTPMATIKPVKTMA
jgi:hypothetical protein